MVLVLILSSSLVCFSRRGLRRLLRARTAARANGAAADARAHLVADQATDGLPVAEADENAKAKHHAAADALAFRGAVQGRRPADAPPQRAADGRALARADRGAVARADSSAVAGAHGRAASTFGGAHHGKADAHAHHGLANTPTIGLADGAVSVGPAVLSQRHGPVYGML